MNSSFLLSLLTGERPNDKKEWKSVQGLMNDGELHSTWRALAWHQVPGSGVPCVVRQWHVITGVRVRPGLDTRGCAGHVNCTVSPSMTILLLERPVLRSAGVGDQGGGRGRR